MKVTILIGRFFGMLGKIILVIEEWVTILFDWTGEVKKTSDSALERYSLEREVDDQLAKEQLEKTLAERKRKANEQSS